MFDRPISISISPNTDITDLWIAIKTLLKPWFWKSGDDINYVEQWFNKYYQTNNAVSFNSGRSALYAILSAFDFGPEDEIIVQSFTCVAAIEPIIWVGAKPVYIDIDNSINISPVLIEKAINKKTKAIIVQHTFGVPASIERIKKITQKHNLILIEDCAHSLGARIGSEKVGSLGDAVYFSFGRDKVISSVFGGMAIINSKLKMQNAK